MTTKTDFKTERKDLYAPSSKMFSIVDVLPMAFLMVEGMGNPNTSKAYKEAIEALYAVSYALKFASKRDLDRDYVVAPLEGLWSAVDWTAFERRAKDEWCWTMMIRQPDWISKSMAETAITTVRAKKALPALALLRNETLNEGRSVQILHIGPYDDEAPVLARLHREYLPQQRLAPSGRHHEIYLSDPRKTAPAKLKTILRQPVGAV
jgi:hypothetical protein